MKSVNVPLQLLSIEGDGYHLMLRVKINGKKANCILDTGASKTVFDSERIKRFLKSEALHDNQRLSTGLGTTTMHSQVLFISKLELGSFVIKKLPTIILDLSHVNQTYTAIGFEPIDGVIGSDILVDAKGIIDFGKSSLTLFYPKQVKSKTARRITAKKSLKTPKSAAKSALRNAKTNNAATVKTKSPRAKTMRSALVTTASRKIAKGLRKRR